MSGAGQVTGEFRQVCGTRLGKINTLKAQRLHCSLEPEPVSEMPRDCPPEGELLNQAVRSGPDDTSLLESAALA
ncbi:MAG: hypothetical protein HDQ87_02405 [Clostridia bacterium]|nr:hypothetical protein [Clostridia bacterium]